MATKIAKEGKRKRANLNQMNIRIKIVLDLMKIGCESWQILDVLVQKEEICRKTARKYLQKARLILGGLGNEPTAEELGELKLCLKHLQTQALNRPEPDLALANQVISNRIKLMNRTCKQKRDSNETNSSFTTPTLSAELESALKGCNILGESERSNITHPGS